MKKHYLRILIALIGVAGFGMAAKGQSVDQIVAKIPYEFVVAGETLPAGTYRVNRLNETHPGVLILINLENGAGVMVLPTMQEAKSGIDTAHVSFEQVGGQHFLSTIETADHLFTIPVSQVEILQAAAKPHSGASGSGSSAGGN